MAATILNGGALRGLHGKKGHKNSEQYSQQIRKKPAALLENKHV